MKTNESYELCPSCKVAYEKESQAKWASNLIAGGGDRMYTYRCPMCGKFHLSSTYSRENHVIYKNAHKFNRAKTNESWKNQLTYI